MNSIADLQENYALDSAALSNFGITTVEDLWACIAKDSDKGITEVVAKTATARSALLAFLIADTLDTVRQRGVGQIGGWLTTLWQSRSRHRADAVLLLLPLLVVGLGLRARSVYRKHVTQVVVKSGASLPPFISIDPQKLVLQQTTVQSGAFATVEEVGKRYPLQEITAGQVVRANELIANDLAGGLQGRYILTLPVKAAARTPTLSPPTGIRLMLSPREKTAAPAILEDVILLATGKQGDTDLITVALTEGGLKTVQPLLGLADVFVLQPIH